MRTPSLAPNPGTVLVLATHLALLSAFSLLFVQTSRAASATWSGNPQDGEWNNELNWIPRTIPNAPGETATFATSNITDITVTSSSFEIDGIVFQAGASPFTITPQALVMSGAGVTNNSGITENFQLVENFTGLFFFGSSISFLNNASAGNATYTATGHFYISGSSNTVTFNDTSTAGSAVFINNNGYFPGVTIFHDQSTADTATLTNNTSAQSDATAGGIVTFQDESTAGSATIVNNGGKASGAATLFQDSSTAASSTLIANGGAFDDGSGRILFLDDSEGGTARIELFRNGLLYIRHRAPGLTIGSIEGSGLVILGRTELRVGSNNLSTSFSGTIEDSGSVTKIGTGKLILSGASTYTGPTIIRKGVLLVNNSSGSGTGTGPVIVKGGTLSGTGTVSGPVTVASKSTRAVLAPGSGVKPGTFTTQSSATFGAFATFRVDLDSATPGTDQLVANGVTMNSAATATIADFGNASLPGGTTFNLINNIAATPIDGTFSNLTDGSTVTIGSNTYLVNYEGGTGNDLTLTVQ